MAIIKRIASKATPKKIVNYLTQEEKTEEKLISGKDCTPENVLNEFKATKEMYNKNEKVQYHHVIQSFSPEDNITHEKAHQLGKELAESQFKGHEVLIVTHNDKDHIHNHLVVNSVNFENGEKYRASNKSLWDIKRESNRLCERENLKTLNLKEKAGERLTSGELRLTLKGELPWKEDLKQCIEFAKERTSNLNDFRKCLKAEFDIETRITNKTISYKHPEKEKPIRGKKLGENYDKEKLENEFIRKEKGIDRTTEPTRAGADIDETSRAEHESENGIRKYFTKAEFGEIEKRLREVEQTVNGNVRKSQQEDRGNEEQQRDIEPKPKEPVREPKPKIRERDFFPSR